MSYLIRISISGVIGLHDLIADKRFSRQPSAVLCCRNPFSSCAIPLNEDGGVNLSAQHLHCSIIPRVVKASYSVILSGRCTRCKLVTAPVKRGRRVIQE